MTRSNGRRFGLIGGVVVMTLATFGGFEGTAGAGTTNPCKVLKKSEIQAAFGGTVSSGKKGLTTPISSQCEFKVSADGDRPSGTVVVHLVTKNGKPAFNGLKKISAQYTSLEDPPNSVWGEKTHVVDVLKGNVLLGVQGGFLITGPPISFYDDQQQLVDLANIGLKRV